MAQKLFPDIHLIMIPPGMKVQEGDKVVFEYLRDQIQESNLLVNATI